MSEFPDTPGVSGPYVATIIKERFWKALWEATNTVDPSLPVPKNKCLHPVHYGEAAGTIVRRQWQISPHAPEIGYAARYVVWHDQWTMVIDSVTLSESYRTYDSDAIGVLIYGDYDAFDDFLLFHKLWTE